MALPAFGEGVSVKLVACRQADRRDPDAALHAAPAAASAAAARRAEVLRANGDVGEAGDDLKLPAAFCDVQRDALELRIVRLPDRRQLPFIGLYRRRARLLRRQLRHVLVVRTVGIQGTVRSERMRRLVAEKVDAEVHAPSVRPRDRKRDRMPATVVVGKD